MESKLYFVISKFIWIFIKINPYFRCLEDHEKLFETLLQWKPKSENRIIFSQRLEKYDVFQRPEKYLPNSESNTGKKNLFEIANQMKNG